MITARVLNVVPTLMCGGTENQFMALARELDRTRFDIEFACLRRWGPFIEELDARRIPLIEYQVSSFRRPKTMAEQARLIRHIRRERVHIVHAYNFYGNVFAIPPARLAGSVTIASIRDRAPYLTPMQKRVQRFVCQFADCILTNASAVKDWLVDEGFDGSTITVIPNGVDLARFDGAPPREQLRRELGLPAGTPLVGVVSRLTRLKGLENFIEAAAILRRRFPDARFLVIGETSPMNREYLPELQRCAEERGVGDRVIFTGIRSDVPAILASLDVSAMPSLNEALSNVLLESMAAGAPTVATRVGGTPEALADRATGLLVEPNDSIGLADAIAQLLTDRTLACALGRAARGRIAACYSVRRMVRATEDVYLDLLERKQRRRLLSAAC